MKKKITLIIFSLTILFFLFYNDELYKLFNSKIIYKIKYGEYLGSISKKFGVKTADIMRWNNLSSDKIKENQRLIIFPKRIPKN